MCDLLLKILVIRMMDFEQVTTALMVQPAIILQVPDFEVTVIPCHRDKWIPKTLQLIQFLMDVLSWPTYFQLASI